MTADQILLISMLAGNAIRAITEKVVAMSPEETKAELEKEKARAAELEAELDSH